MYNAGIKSLFIRDYTNSRYTKELCESIFNATEPYEKEWGADICTRKLEEIQPVIEQITGLRERSKLNRIIILKDYARWCINSRMVSGANEEMFKVTSSGVEKMRKQMVSNPAQLQQYLNRLYDPEEKQTTENIYRCFFWLAFGGVAEEDIVRIKCDAVDFANMVVHYNGTEIPIYREAIPAFRNCAELTQFFYEHPNYTKPIWRDRVPGDTLVRGIRSPATTLSLRVEISRRAREVTGRLSSNSLRLSYFRVWLSGIFFRTYELESIGIKPNFRTVAIEHMSTKTYNFNDDKVALEAKTRQLERDYQRDYQRWKFAFRG